MKRWIWTLAACFGLQANATATAAPVYEELVCRDNDPFVFCTQGCKSPDHHWEPTDPISGAWVPVPPYCPYPTTVSTKYCKGWSQKAFTAFFQYQSICRQAKKEGDWTDKGRRPESTPKEH